MKNQRASWRVAGARGMATLMAVITVLHLGRATAAPGDIFSTPAPIVGDPLPKAADIKSGDTSVAAQTGALQYSYSISVPPGRGGVGATPSLSLAYSSQAPIFGGPAAGRSLNVPRILEDVSKGRLRTHSPGVEKLQGPSSDYADDRFISTMAGGRSLVSVPEPGLTADVRMGYRVQADGTFARYERMVPASPFRWRVLTSDGSTLYFGETANAPGCPISDGFAPLTRTSDSFGNEVNYSYQLINRECLLNQITWGRNTAAGLPDFASLEVKTQRATVCPGGYETGSQLDYRTGVTITTGSNYITSILVKAFDPSAPTTAVHTRQILLGYSNSGLGNTESCTAAHSPVRLLTSIQESAWGSDSPIVNLPAITFTYGSPLVDQTEHPLGDSLPPPWVDSMDATRPKTNLGWGIRRQSGDDRWPTVEAMMLDVNGDGLLDRVQNAPQTIGGVTSCRATWQRSIPGATLSFAAEQPLSWGLTTNTRMPMLRWNGAQEPAPGQVNPGSTQAASPWPYLEGFLENSASPRVRCGHRRDP